MLERAVRDPPILSEQCHHPWEQCVETPLSLCAVSSVCLHQWCAVPPDQTTAVVNYHLCVRVEDRLFQVIEVVIIQMELALEGSVGHAASTLQQVDNLIQNPIEIHPTPFGPWLVA